MNVLMFVMTMLMLLTLMTYARIESFRASTGVQAQFSYYMEESERDFINRRAKRWYDEIAVSSKNGASHEQAPGLAKLSVKILFDEKIREAKPTEFQQVYMLLKKLPDLLYGDQEFFEEMKADASLQDEMWQQVIHAADQQKVTKVQDLANLDLGDAHLNEIFYKMLKGTETKEGGYPSLLDYITMKRSAKIRVYLAPEPILLLLFRDPDTVSEIIETRGRLYRDVVADRMTSAEASEQFKALFAERYALGVEPTMLDFTVSKSAPK
ncbi:MAG: hypothetical protein H7A37_06660 [Chlamydiales bacterium]|nr:hypothetical protein [Chlamydiia bacterium]MCP5507964.1 hypothetical protein [Chlamydiales bacterium]